MHELVIPYTIKAQEKSKKKKELINKSINISENLKYRSSFLYYQNNKELIYKKNAQK